MMSSMGRTIVMDKEVLKRMKKGLEEREDSFKALEEVDNIVSFIRSYFKENNLAGAIIGISGGKDSGVAAGLFCKALGSDNVIGVTMPCHSNEDDKKDALLVSEKFGFKMVNFDLTETFDTYKKEVGNLCYFPMELKNSDINFKPRLRMATLYYLAAMYSELRGQNYIVVGTGNKCEIYVGYFTKGGDGQCDINVLANYTVSEVIKLGEVLGVPEKVLYKKPSDGLSDLSDEDKLGVAYDQIEMFMNGLDDGLLIATKERIKSLHKGSMHKRGIVTYKR